MDRCEVDRCRVDRCEVDRCGVDGWVWSGQAWGGRVWGWHRWGDRRRVTVYDLLVTPVSSPLPLVAPGVADTHQLYLATSGIDLRTE